MFDFAFLFVSVPICHNAAHFMHYINWLYLYFTLIAAKNHKKCRTQIDKTPKLQYFYINNY